jgi:epsilon-lactone hydrolase
MISPEAKKLFEYLQSVDTLPTGTFEEQRAGFDASVAKVPSAEGVAIEPASGRGFEGRWFRPQGAREGVALLHLHGGGFVVGSTVSHRPILTNLAKASGVDILALDYRMAPEHPYPAALDDSMAGYRWLLEQGYAADRIAVAGDSAGAQLALSLMLRAKEEGLPLPACAVMISPWLDLRVTTDSIMRNLPADPLMTPGMIKEMATLYMGDIALDDPRASPVLAADLSGLPPIYIQNSDADILEDDAHLLAARAMAAGVDVTIDSYPGMIHVWHAFAHIIPEARDAFAKIGTFLDSKLR